MPRSARSPSIAARSSRPAMSVRTRGRPRDPLTRPVVESRLAIQARRDFYAQPGAARGDALDPSRVELARFVLAEPVFDGDARGGESFSAAGCDGVRIAHRGHDAAYPR